LLGQCYSEVPTRGILKQESVDGNIQYSGKLGSFYQEKELF
jgi:hypothetical protein